MTNRRTNEDMFALGEWAGSAESELNGILSDIDAGHPAEEPLIVLLGLLSGAKQRRDFHALATMQHEWETTADRMAKVRADKSADKVDPGK